MVKNNKKETEIFILVTNPFIELGNLSLNEKRIELKLFLM
jgi:hypothetical protein